MDEVVKGVRRDERVRAEMKGGRDPGGDVAGHGPVGPGEGGPERESQPLEVQMDPHAVW